jgi:hypothetical protein
MATFLTIPTNPFTITKKVRVLSDFDPKYIHGSGEVDVLNWCAEHLSRQVELIIPPRRLRRRMEDSVKPLIWYFANTEDFMAFKLTFGEHKFGPLPDHINSYLKGFFDKFE